MDLKLYVPAFDTANVYHARDRRVELKFILSKELSEKVRCWALDRMDADPHCKTVLGDSYAINSLYLDTTELDIYQKNQPGETTKYRLRRYADESTIWLETKSKTNNIVQKNRTAIPAAQLKLVQHSLSSSTHWPGDWFRQGVQDCGLQPSALVHYQRFARIASYQNQTIRLTIDSSIGGLRTGNWEIPDRSDTQLELLPEFEILELKFHHFLPPLFKRLLVEFPISSTGYSKYRTTITTSEIFAGDPGSL